MPQRLDSFSSPAYYDDALDALRPSPGKVTSTQHMAARSSPMSADAAPVQRAIDPALAAVQRQHVEHDLAASLGFLGGPAASIDDSLVQAHAAAGVVGGGGALPHLDAIQRSFGPHDVSGVRAHVGGAAADASAAIGAHAYATGNDVAFAREPDLFLAAHEAAHVVQQRQGVHLKGAVGQYGDSYERQADEVAAAVVRGESAAHLLGPTGASVQRTAVQRKETDWNKPLGGFKLPSGTDSGGGPPAKEPLHGTFHAECPIKGLPDISDGASLTLASSRQLRFVFKFDKCPSEDARKGITYSSSDQVVSGSDKACKLGKGAWEGDDLVWTASFSRPVQTKLSFLVLSHGKVVCQETRTLKIGMDTHLIDPDESMHMKRRADSKYQLVEKELQGWRNRTATAFINAKTRVNDLIKTDADAASAADAVALSILSALLGGVLGAVAGPFAKSFVSGETKQELASDLTKSAISTGISIAAASAPKPLEGLNQNETAKFIEYDQQTLAIMNALLARLDGAYQTNDDGHHVMSEDPIAILDDFVAQAGIPLPVRSETSLERDLWRGWLDEVGARTPGSEALEGWLAGTNYAGVMKRLDELAIQYEHPDQMGGTAAGTRKRKAAAEKKRDEKVAAEEAAARAAEQKQFTKQFVQDNE